MKAEGKRQGVRILPIVYGRAKLRHVPAAVRAEGT